MYSYATTKEFAINRIKKKNIDIQVTFILEIKLEMYIIYPNMTIVSATYASILKLC